MSYGDADMEAVNKQPTDAAAHALSDLPLRQADRVEAIGRVHRARCDGATARCAAC